MRPLKDPDEFAPPTPRCDLPSEFRRPEKAPKVGDLPPEFLPAGSQPR